MRLQIDTASARQLVGNLNKLPRRVATKHLRIGLSAAGGVAKGVASSRAAKETGLLGKSMAVKVTIPDASFNKAHHGRPARVMVGPSRTVVRAAIHGRKGTKLLSDRKAAKRVLSGGKVQVRKPSRYAHLAEKKSPAIAHAQVALEGLGMAKLKQKLEQGLAAEAAALAKK